MFQALFAVMPVFLIIGAGVLLRSRDVLPENAGPVLGIYVLKLALPLLILHLLAGASLKDLAHWAFWGGILGSQLVVYCIGYVGDRIFCRRGVGPGVIAGLSCSACNAAFVGLPIVSNLFPGNATAMLIAGLCTLTPNVVMIIGQSRLDALAGSLAWDGGNPLKFVGKLLKVFILGNPILLSTLAGIALSASGLGLWAPLDRAVSLVGYTAAPCMLLAHPLLCWVMLAALGVSGLWLVISVIVSATATALVVTVIAEVYSTVPEEAALTAVVANGLSIFTLTGFVWGFQALGMV